MTFKELIKDIIMDLDEDITDTEVLTKVKRYINRGYKDLAKKECLDKARNVVAYNGKITLPGEAINIYGVFYDDRALVFEIVGKNIYISSDINGEVELIYSYAPYDLEYDEEETLTNKGNDEYIINFAKWQFSVSDGMMDNAIYYKSLVDSHRIIKQNKIVKTIDVYGVGECS